MLRFEYTVAGRRLYQRDNTRQGVVAKCRHPFCPFMKCTSRLHTHQHHSRKKWSKFPFAFYTYSIGGRDMLRFEYTVDGRRLYQRDNTRQGVVAKCRHPFCPFKVHVPPSHKHHSRKKGSKFPFAFYTYSFEVPSYAS